LQGYERVYSEIPDINLDVPHSYSVLERFVEECFQAGIISKPLRDLCPSRYWFYCKQVKALLFVPFVGNKAGSCDQSIRDWNHKLWRMRWTGKKLYKEAALM